MTTASTLEPQSILRGNAIVASLDACSLHHHCTTVAKFAVCKMCMNSRLLQQHLLILWPQLFEGPREQADGNNVHIFFSCNTIQKFITVALLTLGQNPKMYLYLICCSGSPQSFLEIWQAHWKVMTLEWTIKVNFRTEFLSTQFRRLQCIPNYRWILRKT